MRPNPPGATIRTVPYGDRFQTAVVFVCKACPAEYACRFPSGGASYEAAARKTRAAGWEADADRLGANLCPDCIKAKRPVAIAHKPPAPTIPAPEKTIVASPPKPAAVTPASAIRDPTPDERKRIRDALDGHFDDKKGHYLEGHTDQSMGELARVPWALVTRIREAAYGPIKSDPELAAVRAELTAMSNLIAQGQAKLADMARQFKEREKEVAADLAGVLDAHRAVVARFAALEAKRAAA